ncbi:hypothetical protein BCR44DRAFT_1425418 [Catenaria anguillulae PL171]|uniref:Uncharacterized protein n=1 Tax=Catenaria anguillulae PL171 TaxID=765915 RepID=A0A1Y2HYP3_9FUNG|nr:hypothetical protein BCR44DRAFT_1425418 [Catenaria anguillulae PL171]
MKRRISKMPASLRSETHSAWERRKNHGPLHEPRSRSLLDFCGVSSAVNGGRLPSWTLIGRWVSLV